MSTSIILEWREVLLGASVGNLRNIFAMMTGAKHRYGANPAEPWGIAIGGAVGELVVAKHFGIYWDGAIGKTDAGDVDRIEVRTTPYVSGHLIVHPEDPDDAPFVLVVGVPPTLRIVGWIQGAEAKQSAWWKEGDRPAFFVPQGELQPIESLQRPEVAARYDYTLTLKDVRDAARRLME